MVVELKEKPERREGKRRSTRVREREEQETGMSSVSRTHFFNSLSHVWEKGPETMAPVAAFCRAVAALATALMVRMCREESSCWISSCTREKERELSD